MSRPHLVLFAVVGPLFGGCASIAGIDAYEAGASSSGGETSGGENHCAATVARSSTRREDCAACMQENCSTELEACASDPRCAERLACRSMCEDRACQEQCNEGETAQAWGQNYFDGNWPLAVVSPCRASHCAAACREGSDWECVGRYSLSPDYVIGDRFDVIISGREGASGYKPLTKVKIVACDRFDFRCESPIATSEFGDVFALLNVPASNAAGFAGFFSTVDERPGMNDDERIFPSMLVQNVPFRSNARYSFLPWARKPLRDSITARGHQLDENLGHAVLAVSDCYGTRSAGIDVLPEDGELELPAFGPLYSVDDVTNIGTVVFGNLPPGRSTTFRILDRSSGCAVATTTLVPVAGVFTGVEVWPATSEQASSL